MKNLNIKPGIINLLFGCCLLLSFSSCLKKDNYSGPNASLEGTVFNEGSNKTAVQTCTGNFSIRLEQIDWSDAPAPQSIPIKIDGTYKNTKLFAGHYRVSIFGGAFWPSVPEEIDIASGTRHDFAVTPYLYLTNFTTELIGDSLKLNFNLEAPIEGIPDILDIQPYVNTTSIVGPGASINQYSDARKLKPADAPSWKWAEMSAEQKTPQIIIPDLLRGRTFFVRVGVRFDDAQKNSNLSEVIKIEVPQ
ncbi:MAG: DUF3823 domain-containing protein [Ferruginibacter sp.]